MSTYGGDFLGFSIGDVHSQDLNIVRVSSGNRYTENLLPNFKDQILEVPGVDGIYYWDTKYTNRIFTIDFAYDYLGDNEIRELRRLLGFRGIQPLVFDEFPYKKYMVKCQSPPNLKYICFTDDQNKGRVFKGEGTLQLVAYYPFGISTESFIYSHTQIKRQKVVNSGDLPADFRVYYDISSYTSNTFTFVLRDQTTGGRIKISNLINLGTDKYLMVDTKTHLLEGLDENYNKTGNLYNRFISEGDFFKLQVGSNKISSTNGPYNDIEFVKFEYNRIYY